MMKVKILGVATGTPERKFTQDELESLLGVTDEKRARFFRHPHIRTRHFLFNGTEPANGKLREESLAEQREKFRKEAPRLSEDVLRKALSSRGLRTEDVGCLVAVSSSGYFTPGLSVMLSGRMKLPSEVHRLDVLGMGCHAGINGLSAVHNWCLAHPGKIGVLLCAELSSCIYNLGDSDNNALVNSLFGDGLAVVLLKADQENNLPTFIDFASHLIPETENYLMFDWDDERKLYGFHVHKKTPETIGAAVKAPLSEFLARQGLAIEDITEWVVHGGGEAILSSIESHLGLRTETLRHTRSVLRDFGNVASGSFLFSYERLLGEKKLKPYDNVVFMTMGPGLSLELSLLRWNE